VVPREADARSCGGDFAAGVAGYFDKSLAYGAFTQLITRTRPLNHRDKTLYAAMARGIRCYVIDSYIFLVIRQYYTYADGTLSGISTLKARVLKLALIDREETSE